MIYDTVGVGEPIKQGDIFRYIPRADYPALKMVILDEDDKTNEINWPESVCIIYGFDKVVYRFSALRNSKKCPFYRHSSHPSPNESPHDPNQLILFDF